MSAAAAAAAASAAGDPVVTANRRLARALRRAVARARLAEGLSAWTAPDILPWSGWLRRLWRETLLATPAAGRLLGDLQASALWERAAAEALGDTSLLNPAALAERARHAWSRVCDWRVPLEALEDAARSSDHRFFLETAGRYRRACENGGWLDPAALPAALAERILGGDIRPPDRLLLAGFERTTPARTALLDALRQRGCEVIEIDSAGGEAPARSAVREIACADRAGELRAAGAWAREALIARPEASVGIVLPGLERDAERARRLVADGLSPGWAALPDPARVPLNVSYGRPLAEYPLIAAALSLLDLTRGPPRFEPLSRLLRSPFLGTGADTDAEEERARVEVGLRWLPDRAWTARDIEGVLGEIAQTPGIRPLLRTIETITETKRADWRRSAPPSAWAAEIDALLEAAGWAGAPALDSEAWQLRNAWRTLLNELNALDAVLPRVSGLEAVARLSALARATVFQPESGPAAVQLLGPLEALGLDFDRLWIAGLEAASWPPPAVPDPLLPLSLQREHELPDATPAATLADARRILSRLAAGAPEVVLSWPRQEGEAELDPSPLIGELAAGPPAVTGAPVPEIWPASPAAENEIERLVQDPAPGIAAGEQIAGGHRIIAAQRLQPFSAFAEFRLGAAPLPIPPLGVGPAIRGVAVHRALERLYAHIPDSETLAALDGDELTALTDRIARLGFGSWCYGADRLLLELIEGERRRLAPLLREFLALDRQRPAFRVEARECEFRLSLGRLKLKLRLDRLDRTEAGAVVIDYKSGHQAGAPGTDPADPRQLQLASYALALGETPAALALALVNPAEPKFLGVTGTAGLLPGRGVTEVEEWEHLLGGWAAAVRGLAARFAAGDARLNLELPERDQRPWVVLSRIVEHRHGR